MIKNKKTTRKLSVNPLQLVVNILKRFNLVIFIVAVICGLIFSILTLSSIISTSVIVQPQNESIPSTQTDNTELDQASINSLNDLLPSDINNIITPHGRINPFSE